MEHSLPGAKVPGNESFKERNFHGTLAPGSESSMELSLPGAKVPPYGERKFLGAKVPVTSLRYRIP